MSLADTLQVEGFHTQMGVCAETFIHLPTGLSISGVVEVLPTIDPRLQLGSDTREVICLHFLREENQELLSELNQEERFQQMSQPSKPTWIFIRRDDNPGDPVTKLWMAKMGPQDS